MNEIKIVLVDDHDNVRRRLRRLLERSARIKVIGEAENGDDAVNLVRQLEPHVLLLDVEMPGLKGYEVAQRLMEDGFPVKVLAISGHTHRRYVLGMLTSGAVGFLAKEEAAEVLVEAVTAVAEGQRGWLSPLIARSLQVQLEAQPTRERISLAEEEKAILERLLQGETAQELTQNMALDDQAFAESVQNLTRKLEAQNGLEAALRAFQRGLICQRPG